MIKSPKNYRGRKNFNFDLSKFKLMIFYDKFKKNLLSGKIFLRFIVSWTHMRKIGHRKLQVSRDPSKIWQPKDFRGKKSNYVQNFFKCHLKD